MPKRPTKNLNIVLVGGHGRMGQELRRLIEATPSLHLAASVQSAGEWKKLDAAQVDIVVDFSSPEGMVEALAWCVKNKKPLVSGTTGLSMADKERLKRAAGKVPVLYSANMSLGIAALSRMLGIFSHLEGWTFQIEEAHHKQKKDKPSGTALLLQEKLTQATGKSPAAPLSIRGGNIPGFHAVWAIGPDETLVLQHTAFNRQVFAQGALCAARWLFDKKQPGLYELSDLYPMT